MGKNARQQTEKYAKHDRVQIVFEGFPYVGDITKVYDGRKWDTITVEMASGVVMTVGAECVTERLPKRHAVAEEVVEEREPFIVELPEED